MGSDFCASRGEVEDAPVKLHLGCGPHHRLPGFIHHDQQIDGWTYQSGLSYADNSVDCITISHSLNELSEEEWPAALAEFRRVLKLGGVLRITDDDTESLTSKRHLEPSLKAKTRTGPMQTCIALNRAGFLPFVSGPRQTNFYDDSLLIALRSLDYVYFMEGVKP